MILTSHLLTGAAIAAKTANPFLGAVLAILSHYILDFLPHEQYSISNLREKRWKNSIRDFAKIALDLAAGLFLIFLFSENSIKIYLIALLSAGIDFTSLLYFIFPQNKLLAWHRRLHQKASFCERKKIPLFWRIFTTALITVIAILFL